MRAKGSLLLLALLALPLALKLAVLVDFKVNQAAIAKELCVNRTRPMTMCYGRCVLVERMEVADGSEDSGQALPEVLKWNISTFLLSERPVLRQPFPIAVTGHPQRGCSLGADSFSQEIFHPPIYSV